MRVLIIENELYLAQSIAMKLSDLGYHCEIFNSYDEFSGQKSYEVILLSSNTPNFLKAVEKFKNNIVILLISYISTDTVSTPLKMGASDYIQKPFMIEELLRKIKHHQDFKRLLTLNSTYQNYVKSRLSAVKLPHFLYKKLKLPLILQTNKQNYADAFAFAYMNECGVELCYIDLSVPNSVEKVIKLDLENKVLFLSHFQILKTSEREKLLEFIKNKPIILHTHKICELNFEEFGFHCIDFNHNEKDINNNEILTIDEYIKHIILNYQNVFADTELSKKLGISRKSLWEKRKRYEISKKK